MKKSLKVLLIALGSIMLVCTGLYIWMMNASGRQLASITYAPVDMARVSDGLYFGETNAGMVHVRLSVSVEGHSIREIRILEHSNGLGSAAESIVQAMSKQNHYTVDAVSGATLSSEAIKSAVSKALNDGQTI